MRRLVMAGLSLGLASAAGAQDRTGWTQLPNGEWGIMVNYVTSGVFQCGRYVPRGTCVAQGNKLSLTNFGNTLTLEYHPVQDSVFASSRVGSQYHPPFSLGTITKTYSGVGPFTPAKGSVPRGNYVWFRLSASFSSVFGGVANNPVNRLTAHSGQFHTTGHGSMEGGRFAIENVSHPDWDYDDFTPTHFTATATVNPEPVTMLLMATGLAGIGGALRRRKRNRS